MSSLQQKWLANEEKKLKGSAIKDIKREKKELEKSLETMWTEQGLPRSSAKVSKKELQESKNDVVLGGMRNPDLAVERLFMVRETGAKLRAAWEKIMGGGGRGGRHPVPGQHGVQIAIGSRAVTQLAGCGA